MYERVGLCVGEEEERERQRETSALFHLSVVVSLVNRTSCPWGSWQMNWSQGVI